LNLRIVTPAIWRVSLVEVRAEACAIVRRKWRAASGADRRVCIRHGICLRGWSFAFELFTHLGYVRALEILVKFGSLCEGSRGLRANNLSRSVKSGKFLVSVS
jgi:hypothetical protein